MSRVLSEEIPAECLNVLLHVWDYLDCRLTDADTAALRAHLDACPQCDEYRLFQESFLEALLTLRTRQGAPWHVKAKVLETVRGASTV